MENNIELYNRAKEAYYAGKPIMTDMEFDELESELGLENKSYVGTRHNPSYTEKHPYIMGSLSKVQIKENADGTVDWAAQLNAKYGEGTVTVNLRDQYYNMREKVEPLMHIIDIAFGAMKETGVEPVVRPIRGGTDGAQLSFKGLPCPNIFAGGLNFHGRYEFAPVPNIEKAMMVVVKIAELTAKRY